MSQENEVITLDIRGEDGSPMVRLFPDGRLEFGQHYDPRDAALIFWRSLSDMSPTFGNKPIESYSLDELRNEIALREATTTN